MKKHKIIRITTVPLSLGGLLKGQLKFMSQYYDLIGISSKEGDRLNNVSVDEGIRVIPVEMTRKITPFKDLIAVYKLYKIFKEEKPTIVHSLTPKAGTLSMIAAMLAGVPHRLHDVVGLPLLVATGGKRILLDQVEKVTYFCATNIYPNSFNLRDIILKNKYTNIDKLKVIANGSSNGINSSYFDPKTYSDDQKRDLRNKFKINDDDFVFIFVGRLVKDKGLNELVSVFKQISSNTKNVKLLLIGGYENELDPLLPESVKEIDSNTNIISLGRQNDVRPFYSISHALVFPSYREGFPNAVIESGAMGLASIVTDINGCNEIITNGLNGLIIPVKDKDSLYKSMKMLLDDKVLLKKLSENSRSNILTYYKREYVWEELLKEYETMTV